MNVTIERIKAIKLIQEVLAIMSMLVILCLVIPPRNILFAAISMTEGVITQQ